MVEELTASFLREIQADTTLIQSQELAEVILDRFNNYARRDFTPRIPRSIQDKVVRLVNQYVFEIVEKIKNGAALSEAIDDSIKDVDDFVKSVQGLLAHLFKDSTSNSTLSA